MICDFDGTLAFLDLDWDALRADLGVARLGELWSRPATAWEPVTQAEMHAADRAAPRFGALELVADEPLVIISANSERAIARFLARGWPLDVRLVIGRETLAGHKFDPARFAAAVERALAVLGDELRHRRYLGDADEELELAARCGLEPIDARRLAVSPS